MAAMLHAVGLLGISSDILLSPERFQGARKIHRQGYPDTACALLKDIEFPLSRCRDGAPTHATPR
ncbi:MAG: hypothetical protein IH605_19155 [Burkholderiales bacterium]|nr:hypothetical protein [Burkholderiales bacterium]